MGILEQKWGPKNCKRFPWGPGPPNGDPGHLGHVATVGVDPLQGTDSVPPTLQKILTTRVFELSPNIETSSH